MTDDTRGRAGRAETSHTGCDRPCSSGVSLARHQTGFSLLELLVVLFVVVLITSAVTLSVGSGGQDLRLEAQVRGLAGVAGYAMDEAQMRGVDFGLLLIERRDERGYPVYGFAWRQRELQGWVAPEEDSDVFEEQFLESGLELQLELEDSPFSDLGSIDAEERSSPQVVFYASGETTPGALDVRRSEDSELLWRIEWDLLGRFTLLRRGEPEYEDEDEQG